MTKRLSIILILIFATTLMAVAQIIEPVKWTTTIKMTGPRTGVVVMKATIDPGFHVYGLHIPEGGPVATTVEWANQGVKLVGPLTPDRAPHKEHDKTFGMDLSWWTGSVTLTQKFEALTPEFTVAGNIRAMACNDETCTPPQSTPFSAKMKIKDKAPITAQPVAMTVAADTPVTATPAQAETAAVALQPVAMPAAPATQEQTWAPVSASAGVGQGPVGGSGSGSLLYIFLACFVGGLLALLTPCVWPMIPMTVSFFLKKSGSRSKSVTNAIIYGLSIVVIFLLLGIVFTAIFGANALNSLATNAVANIIFFLLLVVFAISFFGAFELKLPDSWSNKMDSHAERTTGVLSIFFMAATLVVVSFSCTGPIIGTLLVEAASMGNMLGPVVGMTGFAIALAIPFALFALFPTVLKKLPRSGGWLNTVKVVLGFFELALSLKFLSVADLAYGWHILDREPFLALWIAIFGTLGLYLLGVFRFKSDGTPKTPGIGVTRFMLALASLAFTAYLVPGLWGAPLKATSAFVPPLFTQDFNLYGGEQAQYDDYDKAMAEAARLGKPVFVDFSGFGCVNCRKMEGAVLSDDGIKQMLSDKFVVVSVMVDDRTKIDKPMTVTENGRQLTLTTVGDKWSYLQRHKFNSNSQPYYVVLNPQGELLSGPFAYKESIPEFKAFLQQGLDKMK